MMLEDVINPAIPATTGALLAEEWTINPLATLPSFLEMFMMDEAAQSARKSLDAGMGMLQQRLQAQSAAAVAQNRHLQQQQQQQQQSSKFSLPFLLALLKQSSAQFGLRVAKLLQKFGPEISCLVLYFLERHCLRSDACATISESLYGGRQAKLAQATKDRQRNLLPLTDRDKTRLALLVALGPYLRHRLLLWYKKLKQQQSQPEQQTASRSNLLQKLEKLFVWVYPFLHVSMSSLDLAYQWRYLLGHSVFFHPYAHYLGLVVRRVTEEDTTSSQGSSSAASTPAAASIPASSRASLPKNSPSVWRKGAILALSSAVVLSWVSHFRAEYQRQRQEQMLLQQQQQQQQQHSEQNHESTIGHNNTIQNNLNIPPPPSSGIANHALPPHLCPLCRQPRVHPTASTSGFVFCYKCLLQHVQSTGKCPVTGRDCREAQLLRLYEPNATSR
jgi:peroxin-12